METARQACWRPWEGAGREMLCATCGRAVAVHLDGTEWPACTAAHPPPSFVFRRPRVDRLHISALVRRPLRPFRRPF
jgi:hypothetical protein